MKTFVLCTAFTLALAAAGQSPKEEAYVLTRAGSSSVTMSGSSADQRNARKALHGDAGIWFRRGGAAYVVTDPGLVARAQGFYKPLEELGGKQGELGKRQGKLGDEMGRLGAQMGTAGARHGEDSEARMDELGAQMDKLGKQMDAMGEQMDQMGKQMDALSAKADRELHALLDEALAKGLAKRAD